MDQTITFVFIIISVLFAGFDFIYAYRSYRQPGETGRFLGAAAFSAGVVVITYLFSIRKGSYLSMSIASSLYFSGIDWMLVALTHFVYLITGRDTNRKTALARNIIRVVAAVDSVFMIVNIFKEIVVHYVPRESAYAPYQYEMRPLYIAHLIFTYALVLQIVFVLFAKVRSTPRKYRNQYLLIIVAVLLVVAVNALFLYPSETEVWNQLDCSIWGYSLGFYVTYWAAFEYRLIYMPKDLSMTIFEKIDQGIVLFDYSKELIMHNERARQLLDVELKQKMSAAQFTQILQLPKSGEGESHYTVQIERKKREPLRCDYTELIDDSGRVIGNLFVFTEALSDFDLLTGFQLWKKFKQFAANHPERFRHPAGVAVFDLVGLREINRIHGREDGDKRIRKLVRILKKHLPEKTCYIRGYEAVLIAIVEGAEEADLREMASAVVKECGGTVIFGLSQTLEDHPAEDGSKDYGLNEETGSRDVLEAAEIALHSLQVKKLLDPRSTHSQTLSSLIKALQESDSETEAHVQRTQQMGEKLGERIGLTDAQMSDLQLLCLLHDIGKIGIPLEILNKPGRLNDNEWLVMRSHPEKGFQICLSSDELRPIANMVLCHHERWDGHGYPGKLAGEDIPLLSRIISIVDAYDAMVNDRPYRKGLSVEAAKAEILSCAGTQFDPHLAEEFLKMLEEYPDIAVGVHIGAKETKLFMSFEADGGESGNTHPVIYSRYLLDVDEKILETDEHFTELTGYSTEEALTMTQFDLIPPEDKSHYIVMVGNQLAKGNIAFLQHDLLRKDGTKMSVFCMGKKYYDSAVKAYRSEIIITSSLPEKV